MWLLKQIGNMYLTMLPLILGGIANMLFTKTTIYQKWKTPIDANVVCKDGRRLLGDNKTWIGFVAMIVFCTFFQVVWGALVHCLSIEQANDLYAIYENTPLFNAVFGALVGLVYMVSELPNSYIKRRLNIDAGKTEKGFVGGVFFIIDQVDSLLGVMLCLMLFSGFGFLKYLGYVVLGAATHIIVNLLLYVVKVRKNI